ncbi:MAG TPA: GTP cyclohydrolase I FolE [Candidatus Marinimicrobia bacterium]|nr:GTP cyclohydrolase I FolE [Candidatus Neomarinimicrobiota bacterium]|tara:strand:+ start:9475 stop:10050 length:576 start_codon:yes stop_codon:yes gene_type:complete
MNDKDKKHLEEITKSLLESIGEDPNREGLLKTPQRVAKSWEFLSKGYKEDLDTLINNAIFEESAKDMVIVKNIEFYSLCEHHLIPFHGKAHVAYIPNGKIIGLSKIPRIIDHYSKRLQVQERLTNQIANTLQDILQPKGVAVVMEGKHFCMLMRGVQKQNSIATTSSMLGLFREKDTTRNEFLNLIQTNNV